MFSFETLIALAFLSMLNGIVKNPARKAQLRNLLLRIKDVIILFYEPQPNLGVLNKRVDVRKFISDSIQREANSLINTRYESMSFDLEDGADKDDNQPSETGGKPNARS